MKLLISLITVFHLVTITAPVKVSRENEGMGIIEPLILAYDAMYTGNKDPEKDYIILDMESLFFTDTTVEDRQKAIQYFQKYNKTVLNASVVTLQQIGLADSVGELKINAHLLMLTKVDSVSLGNLVIEGYKWFAPNSYTHFRVGIENVNNKWKVTKVDILK
ncbi:hypothetical protein [Clostridium sp. YIM B02506]|uniref:hypothetical protein n=1 Tax=Clostridium sp. YIM B02506 TaxID=2910680 RepID=UPI001EEEA5EE|nr:hypothetical protein [Clostridium sp. YIM B02506]